MPSSAPIPSYTDFVKNPVVGLLFMCLIAIGYLYIDNRNTLTAQIEDLKSEVKVLKEENVKLYNKIIEVSKKVN
jgi:hypothetical protein